MPKPVLAKPLAETGSGAILKGGKAVYAKAHGRKPMEHAGHANDAFAGTGVENCYQCGKCAAGCPMSEHMDVIPSRLLRLVQLGEAKKAMRSDAIWYCVSCQTCTARCPQNVDCCGVMDVLRQMAMDQGEASPDQTRVHAFQRIFLDNIRRNGRLAELELTAQFKIEGFLHDRSVPLLMRDSLLAPRLLKRGKLHMQGEKVRDRGVVDRIFARCEPEKSGEAGA